MIRVAILLALLSTIGACEKEPVSRIVELPTRGCRLTSSSPLAGVPIALEPGGPPYATAGTTMVALASSGSRETTMPTFAVEVIVPDGPVAPVGLRYQTNRVIVSGFADPDDVELHPVRAAVTGDFLITTHVRIKRIAGGQAEVEPALGPEIELVGAVPTRSVPCSELSLDELDEPRALAPAAIDEEKMALRAGVLVELAVEPGGPAVARLHPGDDHRLVKVLERRGESTRVIWSRDGGIVFGWIQSSALEEPAPRKVTSEMGQRRPPALASLRCGHDVPLLVDVGGVRTTVGAVRTGAAIAVLERADTAARISLASHDVVPSPGVTLWVLQRDLEDCVETPPEPSVEIDLGRALEGLGK